MSNVDNVIRLGGTSVLRNVDLLPLADAQLKRFAPTIFAKAPIEGVSDNYGFVNTYEIIKAMREQGYECVEVRQSRRRDEGKMPFTKHMLKFKHPSTMKALLKRGDVIPQVVMLNSHDKSSGFHLYAGMFRVVCSNGLIVSDSELVEPIKVRHNIKMVQDILEKAKTLIRSADGVYDLRAQMLDVKLTEKEAVRFATRALEFRPPNRSGLMLPETVLQWRREEDKPNDLWHVFNRVQENIVRGGTDTTTADNRHVKTKGVGRIERDVQVNSRLWELAVQTVAERGKKPARASKKALSADEVLA